MWTSRLWCQINGTNLLNPNLKLHTFNCKLSISGCYTHPLEQDSGPMSPIIGPSVEFPTINIHDLKITQLGLLHLWGRTERLKTSRHPRGEKKSQTTEKPQDSGYRSRPRPLNVITSPENIPRLHPQPCKFPFIHLIIYPFLSSCFIILGCAFKAKALLCRTVFSFRVTHLN